MSAKRRRVLSSGKGHSHLFRRLLAWLLQAVLAALWSVLYPVTQCNFMWNCSHHHFQPPLMLPTSSHLHSHTVYGTTPEVHPPSWCSPVRAGSASHMNSPPTLLVSPGSPAAASVSISPSSAVVNHSCGASPGAWPQQNNQDSHGDTAACKQSTTSCAFSSYL